MDAISLIVNRVTNVLPGIPENWSTPVAPTKPPFLWNAPQGLWTQWRGVQQVPIERNLIETMGVFMSINLHAKTPAEGLFESNAAIGNLQVVENLLVASGAAVVARGHPRQDRPRKGQGRQGPLRHRVLGLPQRVALHLDRTQQAGQAFRDGGLDTAVVCRHRPQPVRDGPRIRHHAATCALPAGAVQGQGPGAHGRDLSRYGQGRSRTGRRAGQDCSGGDAQPARIPRPAHAASPGARVQGRASRRGLGHATFHAQRLGSQSLRDAAAGQRSERRSSAWDANSIR